MTSVANAQEPYVLDFGGMVKAMAEIANFSKEPFYKWRAVPGNTWQQDLLAIAPLVKQELLKIPEMKGYASRHHKVLNDLLAKDGSKIQMPPWDPKTGYGAVALLHLAVKWPVPGIYAEKSKSGQVTPVTVLERPAFKMNVGEHKIRIVSERDGAPIAIITAENGDMLLLQRSDMRPKDGFYLYMEAGKIVTASQSGTDDGRYIGAVIPMINLHVEVKEIGNMLGMQLGPDVVMHALQDVRFYLDPNGALVKSATAVGMGRSIAAGRPTHLVFDGPFLAVVVRHGVDLPIFAGFITPSVFGAPPTWKPRT